VTLPSTHFWYSAIYSMGHGNHWSCIIPDVQNGIADVLGWVSKGTVVGQREVPTWQVPRRGVGATVSVTAWPQTGLRATFVVVRDWRSGRAYLHTAFPAAGAGCKHRIRIESVHEVSCGLEARISGVMGDAAVRFFDPLYVLNRDRYRPGALVDVGLAGIAYSLRILPSGRKLQTAVGDVAMDGAAVLLPAGENTSEQTHRTSGDEGAFGLAYIVQPATFPQRDDYEFCAPVKEVEESEIDAIPVWKFRATVMRFYEGRQEIEIDIYATREGMPEAVAPAPGDEITGTLWLQGTLAPR
jgi:hypothetical protein